MDDTDLLKAIYASATDYAIITMDNQGIITSWNPGAEKILGYARDEIIGQRGSTIFTLEDCEEQVPRKELEAAVKYGRGADDRWHVRKDGSRFWGEGVVTPIRNEHGEHIGYVKIMRDNTARKHAEDETLRLARFDFLTGLPNRTYFQTRFGEMMAANARSEELLILQVIDLDFFKQINDSLGHQAGDLVLQQASQRMATHLRETDFIARLGGDEFVVLQPNAHSSSAGATLASKLLEALSHPFMFNHHEIRIGASIGLAICPVDATDPKQLLEKADLALYRVKNDGRGGFSYFTEHMDIQAHQRARILPQLREAVAQQALKLEYQPEVDCKSGRIFAVEALLRFRNPALSLYPLDQIITIAAEAGLMPTIGVWVIEQITAQQQEWKNMGVPPVRVSVNFCPHELMNRTVTDQISKFLNQSWLHPHDLEIEITERHIFETNGQGVTILEELRSLGISIALDDFGNGYSSLSYLRKLPINRLKLDREFLKEIPRDRSSRLIVEAVIAMAHAINVEVIAEGVETVEQANFFRKKQCRAMQGFFFSPPLSSKDMTELLLNPTWKNQWPNARDQKKKSKSLTTGDNR
jgi:diguanylate cyclase (GGDEF)-like protein/PAS domain S-box-containing protein